MPGILGVYKDRARETLRDLMENMISALEHSRSLRLDRFVLAEKGICLCRASLGVLNTGAQPVKSASAPCWIVFHGELYNNPGSLPDPEYVLESYVKKGDQCVLALKGIFHFVIYDARSGCLKLFSDKFGLQPLYYAPLPDGIIFASEIKALLKEKGVQKTPDYHSFADFLRFGQILGEKTLFKEIKLLPPGAILTFQLEGHHLSIEKYWHLEHIFSEKGHYDPKVSLDDVADLLAQSIKARSTNKEVLGLSLSGGLDSRGILAGLQDKAEGISTYTLGLPGCADEKLAERMSRIAKTKHEFVPLDHRYLENFEGLAQTMIRLSDGMYHPHESTEILALEYFKRADFKILLRGHGGEIAKAALAYPVMAAPEVHAFTTGKEILDYIFKRTNLVIRDVDPQTLFSEQFYSQVKDTFRGSLESSCGKVSQRLAPADVCIYYYINEHIRRQVVASLDIFRTEVEVRLPYVDEDYIALLLKLPVAQRNAGEVHLKLVQKCMPELIKVVNANTGAPMDAGPFRLYVTDKFNSLMRKLSVKGFRHYTEFQDWQRKHFRETTEKILFSKKMQDRDLYSPKIMKNIGDTHISGKKDYAPLLGTLVGIELWFHNFVD